MRRPNNSADRAEVDGQSPSPAPAFFRRRRGAGDHSLVARMVEQNRITPEEARNHPHSNILLRTVYCG